MSIHAERTHNVTTKINFKANKTKKTPKHRDRYTMMKFHCANRKDTQKISRMETTQVMYKWVRNKLTISGAEKQ